MPTTSTYNQMTNVPSCPVCGGLECLCRPRFYAGQLLTEADLQALDHYIVEKNKLHNRHLHGTGVVCGLEVVCHMCKGWVTIKEGYAIDPCGNDVVVCQDYSFNLCDYISRCCGQQRNNWECQPMASPPSTCKDAEQTWLVTLRYTESESRGITALKPATPGPRCPQCGCNGSGASGPCGCGCHQGTSSGTKSNCCAPAASARAPLPQCEPTRTCEGFVVEVAPAPTDEPGTNDLLAGTFLEQIGECLTAIVNLGNEYQAIYQQTTPSAMYQSANQWRSDVWTFLSKHPLTRCELLTAVSSLQALAPPGPQDNVSTYQPTVDAATAPLAATVFEFILECICSALLPPCSGSQTDPRVVLAAVTVKGGDCQIVNICNMARRFVWTWPNFFYWIPLGGIGHALLKLLCCGLSGKLFRESVDNQNFAFDIRKNAPAPGAAPGAAGASGGAAPDAAAGGAGSSPATAQFLRFANLISTIPFFRANSERPADPLAFVKTLAPVFAQALVGLAAGQSSSAAAYTAQLGADSRKLPADLQATPQAVDWPLELWALQLLAQPLLPLGGQPTVAYTAGNTVVGFGVQPNEDLRAQVSQLKEMVAQHQAILSRLPTPPSP